MRVCKSERVWQRKRNEKSRGASQRAGLQRPPLISHRSKSQSSANPGHLTTAHNDKYRRRNKAATTDREVGTKRTARNQHSEKRRQLCRHVVPTLPWNHQLRSRVPSKSPSCGWTPGGTITTAGDLPPGRRPTINQPVKGLEAAGKVLGAKVRRPWVGTN